MLTKEKVETWAILLLQGPHRCLGLGGDDEHHFDCMDVLIGIGSDIFDTLQEELKKLQSQ